VCVCGGDGGGGRLYRLTYGKIAYGGAAGV